MNADTRVLDYAGVPTRVDITRSATGTRVVIPVSPRARRSAVMILPADPGWIYLTLVGGTAVSMPLVRFQLFDDRLVATALHVLTVVAVFPAVYLAVGWVRARLMRPIRIDATENGLIATDLRNRVIHRWDLEPLRDIRVKPYRRTPLGRLIVTGRFESPVGLALADAGELEAVATALRAACGIDD